jgi:hypothetical protein
MLQLHIDHSLNVCCQDRTLIFNRRTKRGADTAAQALPGTSRTPSYSHLSLRFFASVIHRVANAVGEKNGRVTGLFARLQCKTDSVPAHPECAATVGHGNENARQY